MTEVQNALPKWILIASGFFAILEIMMGLSLCFSPDSIADKVDLNAKGVDFLIYMWGSRQFALGVIFALATFKKSIQMLTIAYVFFFVMFLGDLFVGIMQKDTFFIAAAIAMCAISAGLIFVLNKNSV